MGGNSIEDKLSFIETAFNIKSSFEKRWIRFFPLITRIDILDRILRLQKDIAFTTDMKMNSSDFFYLFNKHIMDEKEKRKSKNSLSNMMQNGNLPTSNS